MATLLLLKIVLCARQHLNFIRHLTFWLLFHLWLHWGKCTLGARDSSSAVSGFCQGFGLRSKVCRPSANTENSSPKARKTSGTQSKGNVDFANNFNNMTSLYKSDFLLGALPITAHIKRLCPKGVPSSMLQVYWRVRISSDEVHKRVGKWVLAVCKRT